MGRTLGKVGGDLFSTKNDEVKGTGLTVGDLKSKKGGSYTDADIATMGGGKPSPGVGIGRGLLKGALSNMGSVAPPRGPGGPLPQFDTSTPPLEDMGYGLVGSANPFLNPNAPWPASMDWMSTLKRSYPNAFYGD